MYVRVQFVITVTSMTRIRQQEWSGRHGPLVLFWNLVKSNFSFLITFWIRGIFMRRSGFKWWFRRWDGTGCVCGYSSRGICWDVRWCWRWMRRRLKWWFWRWSKSRRCIDKPYSHIMSICDIEVPWHINSNTGWELQFSRYSRTVISRKANASNTCHGVDNTDGAQQSLRISNI